MIDKSYTAKMIELIGPRLADLFLATVPAATHGEILRQVIDHGGDLSSVATVTATVWQVGSSRARHTLIRTVPGGYRVETFEPLTGSGAVLASVLVEVAK